MQKDKPYEVFSFNNIIVMVGGLVAVGYLAAVLFAFRPPSSLWLILLPAMVLAVILPGFYLAAYEQTERMSAIEAAHEQGHRPYGGIAALFLLAAVRAPWVRLRVIAEGLNLWPHR